MTWGGAGKGLHRGGVCGTEGEAGQGPHREGGCDRGRGRVGAVEQAGQVGTQGTGTKQNKIVKIVLHS